MSTLAVIRAAPESEPFATHRTIIQLPARVLGVVAVMVGLCLVALAADVAEVGPLLLPLVHHPDVGSYGGPLHPLGTQVAGLLGNTVVS